MRLIQLVSQGGTEVPGVRDLPRDGLTAPRNRDDQQSSVPGEEPKHVSAGLQAGNPAAGQPRPEGKQVLTGITWGGYLPS